MSDIESNVSAQAKLAAALAKAQGEFGAIAKNKSVTIRPRDKPSYSFRYADMEELISKTRPALAKNGLSVVQSIGMDQQGQGYLDTVLMHGDGGSLHSRMPIPSFTKLDDPKHFGAAMMYLRRYQYSAMLCLAADDDLDEDGEEAGDPPPQREQRPARKQPKAADEQKPAAGKPAGPGEVKWVLGKIEALQLDDGWLAERGVPDINKLTMDQFAQIKGELLKL